MEAGRPRPVPWIDNNPKRKRGESASPGQQPRLRFGLVLVGVGDAHCTAAVSRCKSTNDAKLSARRH
jgi:hypothetical protein